MKKSEPLPPGEYNMQIVRTRKVRNKDKYRVHMHIIDKVDKNSEAS